MFKSTTKSPLFSPQCKTLTSWLFISNYLPLIQGHPQTFSWRQGCQLQKYWGEKVTPSITHQFLPICILHYGIFKIFFLIWYFLPLCVCLFVCFFSRLDFFGGGTTHPCFIWELYTLYGYLEMAIWVTVGILGPNDQTLSNQKIHVPFAYAGFVNRLTQKLFPTLSIMLEFENNFPV